MPGVTVVTGKGIVENPVYATGQDFTLYVRTTGNDANDGLTVGNPLLTIQAAVDKIPTMINHTVVVDIGTGTFAGFDIMNRSMTPYEYGDPSNASSLLVKGVLGQATPATGTATGTSDGGSYDYLEDSGQSWTVNDLRGRFIITNGYTRLVKSNTATRLDLVGESWASMDASAYEIVEPKTVIEDTVKTPISINNCAFYGWPGFVLQNMKVARGPAWEAGIDVHASKNAKLEYVQVILPSGDACQSCVHVADSGEVTLNEVYAADNLKGGFMFIRTKEVIGTFMSFGVGGNSGYSGVAVMGGAQVDYGFIVSNGNVLGDGLSVDGPAYITVIKIECSDNGKSGVKLLSGAKIEEGRNTKVLGSGNTRYGIEVFNGLGTGISFCDGSNITGALGDVTLDYGGSTVAWADFSVVGDVVVDMTTGGRMRRTY